MTMFCFWEEHMRARDSVRQNRCRMQGICVVGDCRNTGYAVFLFIQYIYRDETWPETRKRPKKWVDLCEAKIGEPSRISSILVGFATTVKTYSFSWPVYSSLSLVESLTFSWYCMRHEFGISWKPSDYPKRKRSILQVHQMKLHGKLNASVFLLEIDTFTFLTEK